MYDLIMWTVSCKDVDIDCEFVGRADTQEELMMQVVGHVVKMHKLNVEDAMKLEMREKLKAYMQKIWWTIISISIKNWTF